MTEKPNIPRDRVFQLRDGWYCVVSGRTFGTWTSKAIAKAGMEVEQRRAAKRLGPANKDSQHG